MEIKTYLERGLSHIYLQRVGYEAGIIASGELEVISVDSGWRETLEILA